MVVGFAEYSRAIAGGRMKLVRTYAVAGFPYVTIFIGTSPPRSTRLTYFPPPHTLDPCDEL